MSVNSEGISAVFSVSSIVCSALLCAEADLRSVVDPDLWIQILYHLDTVCVVHCAVYNTLNCF